VTGALLVARQDAPDVFLFAQRVVDRQNGAARNAEQHVNAFALQTL
jgi:hypothetical protein